MEQRKWKPLPVRERRKAARAAVEEIATSAYQARIQSAIARGEGHPPVRTLLTAMVAEMDWVRTHTRSVPGCCERFSRGDVREAVGWVMCEVDLLRRELREREEYEKRRTGVFAGSGETWTAML